MQETATGSFRDINLFHKGKVIVAHVVLYMEGGIEYYHFENLYYRSTKVRKVWDCCGI